MSYVDMLLSFGMPGPTEWIVIGVVAVLIFGNRLPDVGRSVGKSIVEFKKGLKGIKEDIDKASDEEQKQSSES